MGQVESENAAGYVIVGQWIMLPSTHDPSSPARDLDPTAQRLGKLRPPRLITLFKAACAVER